jgi:hypothetical protein
MSAGGNWPEREYGLEARFPGTVLTAGVLWIVFGALSVLGVLLLLALAFVVAGAPGPRPRGAEAEAAGVVCGLILGGLFGAAFIFVGVQTVRGTAKDTLGNGIGSIIFAALALLATIFNLAVGQVPQAVGNLITCVGLMVAGILALVGRADYRAWKQVHEATDWGGPSLG